MPEQLSWDENLYSTGEGTGVQGGKLFCPTACRACATKTCSSQRLSEFILTMSGLRMPVSQSGLLRYREVRGPAQCHPAREWQS